MDPTLLTKGKGQNKLYTCKFSPPPIHFKTTFNVNRKTVIIFTIIQTNFPRNYAMVWTVPLKVRIQRKDELSWSDSSKFNYKRKRQINILWFNPPYSKTVTTKIGKFFLQLIEKHFPKKHKFYKIFNGNLLKLSYSCMPNNKTKINAPK